MWVQGPEDLSFITYKPGAGQEVEQLAHSSESICDASTTGGGLAYMPQHSPHIYFNSELLTAKVN